MGKNPVWVEHLQPDACLALLASRPVGRLGVIVGDAPEIYPINHIIVQGTVVFRTNPGTKASAITRHGLVCFEVDDLDEDRQTGWSVLVKGRAAPIVDPLEIEQAAMLPLHLWELGDQADWMRITPTQITGRRIWHRDGFD